LHRQPGQRRAQQLNTDDRDRKADAVADGERGPPTRAALAALSAEKTAASARRPRRTPETRKRRNTLETPGEERRGETAEAEAASWTNATPRCPSAGRPSAATSRNRTGCKSPRGPERNVLVSAAWRAHRHECPERVQLPHVANSRTPTPGNARTEDRASAVGLNFAPFARCGPPEPGASAARPAPRWLIRRESRFPRAGLAESFQQVGKTPYRGRVHRRGSKRVTEILPYQPERDLHSYRVYAARKNRWRSEIRAEVRAVAREVGPEFASAPSIEQAKKRAAANSGRRSPAGRRSAFRR